MLIDNVHIIHTSDIRLGNIRMAARLLGVRDYQAIAQACLMVVRLCRMLADWQYVKEYEQDLAVQ